MHIIQLFITSNHSREFLIFHPFAYMTLDIDCLADETEIIDFDMLGALSPELGHHLEQGTKWPPCYEYYGFFR